MAADEGFWLGGDGWLADRCTETTKRRRRRRMPEGARASTGRFFAFTSLVSSEETGR